MTDELETLTNDDLLSMAFQREAIMDYWLEDLVPEQADDDQIAWMTGREGRPRWMPQGPDVRQALRDQVDAIVEKARHAQTGEALRLFELIPDSINRPTVAGDWRYVGATRLGEAWFTVRGGTLRFDYDIAVVRCPLTHPTLQAALLDREKWLEQRRTVFEWTPST